jgi:autotransporter-associated beta strand protein
MTGGQIIGGGTLVLNGNVATNASATTPTIAPQVNLNGGTRTFTIADGAPASDLTVSGAIQNGGLTKTGAGALKLTGNNTYGGATTVTGGMLEFTNSQISTASVAVSGASSILKLTSGGAANRVLKTGALSVTTGGKLDLTDNKLIVTGGSIGTASGGVYTDLSGLIQSGRNGGAWNGNGIVTSMADAASGLTSIGIATAGHTGDAGGTFGGVSVSATDVLAMYTYAGDANLDGFISGDDYAAIDFNIALPNSSGWYNGDFNYDGIISGDDYTAIDFNIVAQGAPFPTGGGAAAATTAVTPVPEPTAGVAALALLVLPLTGRRRHRDVTRPSGFQYYP